ncbi:MAG TPA: hypothetical protein VGG20_18945, partial [Thermoanaerobaculia bacterium]
MLPITHDLKLSVDEIVLPPGQSRAVEVEVTSTGTFVLRVTNLRDVMMIFLEQALPCKFTDPDGRVILDHPWLITEPLRVDITMAMLNRVRDVAGYLRRPWTIQITSPQSILRFLALRLAAQILEDIASSSAPPLINGVSMTLQPQIGQTLAFTLNRLGQIRIDAATQPASADVRIELLDPPGTVVPLEPVAGSAAPAGTVSLVSGAMGLLELHQAQKKDAPWNVRVTCGSEATCQLTAQVYDSLTIPAAVLQIRLDAIFGKGKGDNNLTFTLEHDTYPVVSTETLMDASGKSFTTTATVITYEGFLCLRINDQDVAEFFDSIGVLGTLEDQDRVLRTPRGQTVPLPPAQLPLPQTGITYRVYDLGVLNSGGHNFYPQNLETDSISI